MMSKIKAQRGQDHLTTDLPAHLLLDVPLLNKGSAFTEDERGELGLHGLLPPEIETLDTQVARAYEAYRSKDTDIGRHIYLRQLQDTNETLFYRLLLDHLAEMMPMIYTPTVGAACQRFSHIYRRARGLFLSWPNRDRLDEMLASAPIDPDVIVVTDGERILGLGDQGAGGMGIPIGKLSLYTACGGIDPAATLPIVLDVGTNNEERLNDPFYLGWRHPRITGADYDNFIEAFVSAVQKRWPDVLLQWEDFAQPNAAPILARYRDRLCTFNDDIQGTASVALGTLLAALEVTGARLTDQRVVVLGGGSAGCGIAEQILGGMVDAGLDAAEARKRFYMVDRNGLIVEGMGGLTPAQTRLAQSREAVADWQPGGAGTLDLTTTIRHAKATVLIGVCGVPDTFIESAVRAMAENTARPVIFPLSNPTSRAEGKPADILAWTDGRAMVATGSPFDPVAVDGRNIRIAQCNNSYIFPGMGLGILASGARRVSDGMFMAAARALADCAPALKDPDAPLLPPLTDVRQVSERIARAVAKRAQDEGHAPAADDQTTAEAIARRMWQPRYVPIRRP